MSPPPAPAPAPAPAAAPPSKIEPRRLILFTRTPLHVGAGASVGAIDQPVQRERHTGFPIIPGSTLKGVFADEWTEVFDDPQKNEDGTPKLDAQGKALSERKSRRKPEGFWLFGKEAGSGELTAGALQFGEARVLAFPVRSARGSFAWLTCPLMLRRAVRDGVLKDSQGSLLKFADDAFTALEGQSRDEHALLAANGPLALEVTENGAKVKKVVLEEYTFTCTEKLPADLGDALQRLLPGDEVWKEVAARLVILSDGMMSFFATTACEVAQHVTIDDTTGTAKDTGLFNQENVPSETLFYAVLHAMQETGKQLKDDQGQSRQPRPAKEAVDKFWPTPPESRVFQFGADATTGLGYCTVRLLP